MPQSDLVKAFLLPSTPKRARLSAARGIAPLPPGDLLELLVAMLGDPDAEIAAAAKATLAGLQEEDLALTAKSDSCSPAVLDWVSSCSRGESALESVIQNANTPAETLAKLAARVSGQLIDVLLYNKVRIIENPAILESLKQNPALTPQATRLILEIETEFFRGKNTAYEIEAPAPESLAPDDQPPPGEALPDLTPLEGLPVDPAEREGAILEKLSQMTVPQKLHQAMFGPREVRTILIRDTNREVAKSVLRSPKLTESEVEGFAAMRNVTEDVLREIGNSRDWTRSYAVVHNLIKNPKTPPMISQRLLSRLHNRDLLLLSRDRGVPEAVRRSAQRMAAQRASARPGG